VRRLTATAALIAVLCAGCPPIERRTNGTGGTVTPANLKEGQAEMLRGEYEKAERTFRAARESGGARAAYWHGRALAALGHYKEAREALDAAAAAMSEADPQRLDALLWAADCAYWYADWKDAAARYQMLLGGHAGALPRTRVMLRLSRSLMRSGRWDSARAVCGRLLRTAPTAEVTEAARAGLLFCEMRRYVIQAAAFSKKSAAEKMAEALRSQGLDARIHTWRTPERTVHQVWIGEFSDYRDAVRELSRVRARERLQDAVVRP